MEEFQEVTLESERLMLKRARYDLHYKVINKVVCDTQEHLEPWIVWAKTKPTLEVIPLIHTCRFHFFIFLSILSTSLWYSYEQFTILLCLSNPVSIFSYAYQTWHQD